MVSARFLSSILVKLILTDDTRKEPPSHCDVTFPRQATVITAYTACIAWGTWGGSGEGRVQAIGAAFRQMEILGARWGDGQPEAVGIFRRPAER